MIDIAEIPSIVAKGERVLTCLHPSPEGVHWYWLGQTVEVRRSDGETFRAQWACLCDECHRNGGNLMAKVKKDFVLDHDMKPAAGTT